MSVAYSSPATWGQTPWQRWTVEVAEAAGWATRTLAHTLAVLAVWPLRLAWQVVRAVRWESGEALVSTVVLGMPALMLVRLLPRVHWPTIEQAAVDLQRAAVVLSVAFLALTSTRMQHGAGRACCAGGHRHLVPSPDGTKTWRWIVSVHEAGHLVVGKKLGRRTGKAKIAGGGGYTIVHQNRHDIVGEVAIDRAGRYAAGTGEGCSGDEANLKWRLKHFVEPGRRATVRAAGDRKARALVAAHRGEILRKAREIYDRGWTQ